MEKQTNDQATSIIQEAPRVLNDFLKLLGTARRLSSLYGADHPNTKGALEAFVGVIDEFLNGRPQVTIIFTKDAVVVNDCYYPATIDSIDVFQRFRARGTMAITFVGLPTAEQLQEFLSFLNVEPREVRQQGGASNYLKKHGVSRIAVTEAVYTGGEGSENDESGANWNPNSVDRAVAAVIDWLDKNDNEGGESVRLPLAEILSQPDMAAKLIREAVTKLHASRRSESAGDIANDVLHKLKDVATITPDQWDQATPQIRKAIMKLPKDARPTTDGLAAVNKQDSVDSSVQEGWKSVDAQEVESLVANTVGNRSHSESQSMTLDIPELKRLFGAKTVGLPTIWHRELRPTSLMRTSGNTYAALLQWENSAIEHCRIARALANLIPKAVEEDDMEAALDFCEVLLHEITCEDKQDWHCINAKAALDGIELPVLKKLVEDGISGSYHDKGIAASLVEKLPRLAVGLIDMLTTCKDQTFIESLKQGIVQAGQPAVEALGQMLKSDSKSLKLTALELLVGIGSPSAVNEVAVLTEGQDTAFAVKALMELSKLRLPIVTETCIRGLTHRSTEVRCAALSVLGGLGDESVVPFISKIAMIGPFKIGDVSEKVAAIEALGRLGGVDELPLLDKIANRKLIFGRNKYEPVREAAKRAAMAIRERHAEKGLLVA